MVNGYNGRILFVDLTTRSIKKESLPEEIYRLYIGGQGLGVRILFEYMNPCIDPLGPENILGFVVGPLTGTGIHGARYQVVMVRLDGHEQPMDRQEEFAGDRAVKIAGALCRDSKFWEYLHEDNQIIDPTEKEATEWLREYLGVRSRADLKTQPEARVRLDSINMEFTKWQQRKN